MKTEWLWNFLARRWDTPGVDLGENDRKLVEKTRRYLSDRDKYMDYGCATGSIALELAGDVQEVLGIDISPKMIDIANRRAAERNLTNIRFSRSTIFDLSVEDTSIDVITAFSILHLLDDPSGAIRKVHRLLKPGGRFILFTPCLGQKKFVSLMIVSPVYCLSRIGLLPVVRFFDLARLQNFMKSAGFNILETDCFKLDPLTEVFIAGEKPL